MQLSASQSLYGETGEYAHLFTTAEYESMSTKRVRREIRDISSDQWNRIANAMDIMKSIPEDISREIYGDYYRNYDALVCQHYVATVGPMGDLVC